jgi:hypothetical protein
VHVAVEAVMPVVQQPCDVAPPVAARPVAAPMTKAAYEAQQSRVREVLDPETGRMRYVGSSSCRCFRCVVLRCVP